MPPPNPVSRAMTSIGCQLSLQDGNDWTRWEADRRALAPKFANAKPSPRYALATNKA